MAKGRNGQTNHNKEIQLRKFWNNCPKLQLKISLEKWLEQIRKPNEKG